MCQTQHLLSLARPVMIVTARSITCGFHQEKQALVQLSIYGLRVMRPVRLCHAWRWLPAPVSTSLCCVGPLPLQKFGRVRLPEALLELLEPLLVLHLPLRIVGNDNLMKRKESESPCAR